MYGIFEVAISLDSSQKSFEVTRASLTRFICYLSFQAASADICVWFVVVLLEANSCGPASWVISGRFLWTLRGFAQRKASQGGITAATDMERHICGRESGVHGGRKERDKKGKGRAVEWEQKYTAGYTATSNHLLLYPHMEQITFFLSVPTVAHFWGRCSIWTIRPLQYLLNYMTCQLRHGKCWLSCCFHKRSVEPQMETLYNLTIRGLAWLEHCIKL